MEDEFAERRVATAKRLAEQGVELGPSELEDVALAARTLEAWRSAVGRLVQPGDEPITALDWL